MQRKRHINFKDFLIRFSGSRKSKLHSIPILLSMKKSVSQNDHPGKPNVLYSIPCGCALALLLMWTISLVSSNRCSAKVPIAGGGSGTSSASLSLSNTEMTSSAVTPGSTATVSTNVIVEVTNAESYSLTLAVDNANLTNGSTTIVPGNVVSDNTWGYKWDNASTYTAPSTVGAALTNLPELDSNGAASFTKNLTFAAKFGDKAESGTYHASGKLNLVATPKTVTNVFGVETMQEMTKTICMNATENDTAQLRDARDGTYYWVAKLKDGNCWMTQNLAIDIPASNLTASLTAGGTTAWDSGASNETKTALSSTGTSFKFGNYVINSPVVIQAKASSTSDIAPFVSFITNVDGWTASDDPNFYTNNSNRTTNSSSRTYDAHFLLGNYYFWSAAAAGWDQFGDSGDAVRSICPANWRLPSELNSSAKGSYVYLLKQYGLSGSTISSGSYNIATEPLFLARMGYINNGTNLYNIGREGMYQTGSYSGGNATIQPFAVGSGRGYDTITITDSISMMGLVGGYAGSVRCLVQY